MIDMPIRFGVGVIILLFGRQIFWVVLVTLGFIVGANLTMNVLSEAEFGTALLVGAAAGCICAALAIYLKKVAIGVGGFLGGMDLAMSFLEAQGTEVNEPSSWLIMIICGIAGALLLSFVFDYALIALSSLWGAVIMVRSSLALWEQVGVVPIFAILVLTIIGLAVQLGTFLRSKRGRD